MGGAKLFSAIDSRSGQNQIRVTEGDIEKTAIGTGYGGLYGELSKCEFKTTSIEYCRGIRMCIYSTRGGS